MKKYPFIKMTFWRGDTEEIIAKLSAEMRAKNVIADVVEGTGVGELAVEANLTLPYFSPQVEAMPERYRDPRSHWTSTRISYYSIAYNTRLVPPDQVPKTYDDLLDPRWRGKLAWRIGSSTGTPLFLTNIRLARGEEKATEYFRKLATQKIINFGSGSARTLVDRVIAGEFPIALNIFAHHPLISRAKGAPVNSQLMDPVPSTAGTMMIPRACAIPMPRCCWRTSFCRRKGSKSSPSAEYFPVRPDVPPKDVLASVIPCARRRAGACSSARTSSISTTKARRKYSTRCSGERDEFCFDGRRSVRDGSLRKPRPRRSLSSRRSRRCRRSRRWWWCWRRSSSS